VLSNGKGLQLQQLGIGGSEPAGPLQPGRQAQGFGGCN
jgi:hypothetical protein